MSANADEGGEIGMFRIEQWECPLCDETGTQVVQQSPTTENNTKAEKSLRLHLRKNSGNGHGTEDRYPSGYSQNTPLQKYITEKNAV